MSGNLCARCKKKMTTFSWETMCYQCQKEHALAMAVEAIKNGEEDVDTGSSDYVICPYCGCATEADWPYEDFPELFIDGSHEIDCPECEKTFILETTISYSYETRKAKWEEQI